MPPTAPIPITSTPRESSLLDHHASSFRSSASSSSSSSTTNPPIIQQRIATSENETIFLSSAGDVLVCFERDAHTLVKLDTNCYCTSGVVPEEEETNADDNLSHQIQTTGLCSPWKSKHNPTGGGGLLGGAPPPPRETEDEIALIQSFDYSQFTEANDIPPDTAGPNNDDHPFFVDIPCFFPAFRSIKIATVSAFASHALLITRDSGLLYAYGNNSHGQLGVGARHVHHVAPTIVTALAQAGGKVVDCAAGQHHSLVTVRHRQQQYQVYGFGKTAALGLVAKHDHAKSSSCTVLPRRVRHLAGSRQIAVQAGVDRSAAAVVNNVYTWGLGEQPMERGVPYTGGVQQVALTQTRVYCVLASGECWGLADATTNWTRVSLPAPVHRLRADRSRVVACCATGDVYRWKEGTSSEQPPEPIPSLAEPVVDAAGEWLVTSTGIVYAAREGKDPQPAYGGLRLWYDSLQQVQ